MVDKDSITRIFRKAAISGRKVGQPDLTLLRIVITVAMTMMTHPLRTFRDSADTPCFFLRPTR
jgi:hypothetical protein